MRRAVRGMGNVEKKARKEAKCGRMSLKINQGKEMSAKETEDI